MTLEETIEYLKDHNFVLPYSSAQGFCYLNLNHFAPNYQPTYKKYFKPFRGWKHNTFYHINDIRTFLRRHLSDSAIKAAGFNTQVIGIEHVIVAGLTERECNDLIVMDNEEILPLQHDYNTTILDTIDTIMPFCFGKKEWEDYELNTEFPRNNFLVFTLKLEQ